MRIEFSLLPVPLAVEACSVGSLCVADDDVRQHGTDHVRNLQAADCVLAYKVVESKEVETQQTPHLLLHSVCVWVEALRPAWAVMLSMCYLALPVLQR